MKIKDWEEFQHYKKRHPPWIRLYRHLLNDFQWHSLPGESAKVLVMLWLLASEDPKLAGNLPSINNICFRLRMSEKQVKHYLSTLSHWIIMDEKEMLALCNQDAMPEAETEAEQKQKNVRKKKRFEYPSEFEKLWKLYPGTAGSKKEAYGEYKKAEIGADEMAVAIENQILFKQRQEKAGEFVSSWPHMCRWIKKERWNDKLNLEAPEKIRKILVAIRDSHGSKSRYADMTDEEIAELEKSGYKKGVDGVYEKPYDSGIKDL
jgi:hypothetical protein